MLEVRQLNVEYYLPGEGPRTALRDINFTISSGEVIGALGESGAGKTTLALAMLGLLPSNARVSGSISLRGQPLLGLSEFEWNAIRGAQITFASQEPAMALNPVMRVGDQIAEVIRAHRGWDRNRCREATVAMIAEMQLPDPERLYPAYPHELSGGQLQRIVIAQSLACRPDLMIADEPTTALDTVTQAEILALMKHLKTRFKMAILMITHDPATLTGLADRVLVFHQGALVEEGSFAQVIETPHHSYTRCLVASMHQPTRV